MRDEPPLTHRAVDDLLDRATPIPTIAVPVVLLGTVGVLAAFG